MTCLKKKFKQTSKCRMIGIIKSKLAQKMTKIVKWKIKMPTG